MPPPVGPLRSMLAEVGMQAARAPVGLAGGGVRMARGIAGMTLDAAGALAAALIDAALRRALEGELVEQVLARVQESGVARRVTERLLADGTVEQVVARIAEGPELERIVAAALESDQLWVLVDEIAQSPAVTAAITQQGRGFVEEVADRARDRSRTADAWLVRAVRRRRAGPSSGGAGPAALPETGPP